MGRGKGAKEWPNTGEGTATMDDGTMEDAMDDQRFLTAFEEGTLETFPHGAHLRAVWLYLRDLPMAEGTARFMERLQFNVRIRGAEDKYHATVTWAFVLLVNERMVRHRDARTWEEFLAQNRDLLDDGKGVLGRYYRPETLGSDLARRVFLMPDRLALA